MTNAITLFDTALPSHFAEGMDEDTKALAGKKGGSLRRLSIKGGVFREMIGCKEYRVSEDRAMNVAVVRVAPHNSRQYYAGSYVEGQAVAPTCWSSDGQKPDVEAKERQAPTCVQCPQNIKGSGQGEGRACRFQRRIAVVIEHELARGEVYQLICPATSVFGDGENGKMPLQKYAHHLNSHNMPITKIVTEVRFDTSATQEKLVFKAIRPLTNEEFAIIKELRDSPEAIAAVSMNAAQTDGVTATRALPAPDKLPLCEAPAPKAVAVPAVSKAEEVIQEPKRVPSKKIVPESKLEDLVSEWDDN